MSQYPVEKNEWPLALRDLIRSDETFDYPCGEFDLLQKQFMGCSWQLRVYK